MAFAQVLNCLARPAGCGQCVECRLIAAGHHPDVRLWEPEGRNTKIGQVRQLIEQAQWRVLQGRWKVHVLHADTLTLEAANCLLKTLEEPAEATVLLLLSSRPRDLLPTLRSRCQRVAFGLVDEGAIAGWLERVHGRAPEEAKALGIWAAGRPGRAHARLPRDPTDPLKPMPDLTPFLHPRWEQTLAAAEKLAQEEEPVQIGTLEALVEMARDEVLLAVRDPEGLAGSLEHWETVASCAEETRQGLVSHGNARLLWTVLANRLVQGRRSAR